MVTAYSPAFGSLLPLGGQVSDLLGRRVDVDRRPGAVRHGVRSRRRRPIVRDARSALGLILGGVLTQTLSWRYSMYVNLVFAIIAITGALTLLHNQAPRGQAEAGHLRRAERVGRPVLARVRLVARADDPLGATTSRSDSCSPACCRCRS
jgi:hypothetical protein